MGKAKKTWEQLRADYTWDVSHEYRPMGRYDASKALPLSKAQEATFNYGFNAE
jgi:hypothetical protein